MHKLILRNHQSLVEIVMLTAAVRDLKRALGAVDVRTPCPALWEHSPHLTPLADGAEGKRGARNAQWGGGGTLHQARPTPHHSRLSPTLPGYDLRRGCDPADRTLL